MNHYPRHVGDYIRDTVGLSMLEEGAYTRLLDQYYLTEGALPLDMAKLYRMARATSKAERAAVDTVVGEFFVRADDGYRQKRADRELDAIYKRSDSARESASRRWAERNANAMRTHSERIANGMRNGMRNGCEVDAESMLPITQHPTPNTQEATQSPPDGSLRSPSSGDAPPVPGPQKARSGPLDDERKAQARAVWQAYADAYEARYGAPPVRNAKVNANVVAFLKRVPADEGPPIAASFLRNNAAFYVGRGHDFGCLLADAEKLRTEWVTGNAITATQARQADRTAAIGNTFGKLIASAERTGTHG